jgi:hypothetical protein
MSSTTNEKYNEQELKNINEIEELLDNYNEYVSIEPGGSKILQFILKRKIEEVEKTYNGQTVKKIRFIVIEQNSNNKKEKAFYVGRRSARLIIAKLKEGHTLLKIERIGSGKDTLYLPTTVESNK